MSIWEKFTWFFKAILGALLGLSIWSWLYLIPQLPKHLNDDRLYNLRVETLGSIYVCVVAICGIYATEWVMQCLMKRTEDDAKFIFKTGAPVMGAILCGVYGAYTGNVLFQVILITKPF
jgi:hypothetical protein